MNFFHDESLEAYLNEINRFDLLSAEEEVEIGRRVAKGDRDARDTMIRANLRLVVSVAKQYTRRGLALADLIEEGNIGLLKAVDRFDAEAGFRFSTYATWWIKQAIRRALINTVKTVRIPSYMVEMITKWKSASTDLLNRLNRNPAPEEIARELDLSPEAYTMIRRIMRAETAAGVPVSFEVMLPQDELRDEKSAQAFEDIFNREEIERIYDLMKELGDREAQILRLRYGLHGKEPLTLKEIGEAINLTRERVRQLENEALRKLHSHLMHGRNPPGAADHRASPSGNAALPGGIPPERQVAP